MKKKVLQRELTAQQEAFAQAMASGLSQTAAYRKAYQRTRMSIGSVSTAASRLMSDPRIRARVKELRNMVAEVDVISTAEVLRELARIGTFDIRRLYAEDGSPIPIHKLDDDSARVIQGVDIHEEYTGTGADRVFVGYTKKYKVAPKNEALDKIARILGMYERDNAQQADALATLLGRLQPQVVAPGVPLTGFPAGDEQDDDDAGGSDED